MDADRFEELVALALETLPDEIAARIDNVDIEVREWPTREQARAAGARGLLLGLYQGVPLTRRHSSYGMVLPDRITIFQGPIEAISRSEAELVDQVRDTVVHEVAHHFGISDERLREIERDRRARQARR
jgi:predicted Zn-dependent protease with MMP-like domain